MLGNWGLRLRCWIVGAGGHPGAEASARTRAGARWSTSLRRVGNNHAVNAGTRDRFTIMGVKLPGWGVKEGQWPVLLRRGLNDRRIQMKVVWQPSFIFAFIISRNETESTLTKMLLVLFPAGNVLLACQTDLWSLLAFASYRKVKLKSERRIGSKIMICIPANNHCCSMPPKCGEKNKPNHLCTYFTALIIGWESVISGETKTSIYCCRLPLSSQQPL